MDLKRIFIKDACPTKIGGQAIIEGIMMRGADRTATVIRLPDRSLHIKTEKLPKPRKINKIPVLRGVAAFVKLARNRYENTYVFSRCARSVRRA